MSHWWFGRAQTAAFVVVFGLRATTSGLGAASGLAHEICVASFAFCAALRTRLDSLRTAASSAANLARIAEQIRAQTTLRE